MGRSEKSVLSNGIDKRELGYYSTPEFIAVFMTQKMLEINPQGTTALDPCVGKEELIQGLYNANIDIDGIDVFNHGDYFRCNFIEADFIDYYGKLKKNLPAGQEINLKYDYIIANPPYNCHEIDYIKTHKKELNTLFADVGVYNMYSIFISAIIDSAKEGALISIITSDSFLTSRMHNPLRAQILTSCTIHHLILCPSDLFLDQKADVRTCIMILQKGKKYQGLVKTLNRPKNKFELQNKLETNNFIEEDIENIVNVSGDKQFEFIIDIPIQIQNLFSYPRIGEKYRCITGISTGQDALFISKEKKAGFEIPFYKNPGSKKFFCEPDGFLTNDYLRHDKEIKNFMVRNKSFMLREGITCSSMGLPFSACYLPEGSTFGVNANIFCDEKDIWWLIGYLNSSIITYIVRGVLIRSNMITSGYVSKIPVIELKREIKDRLAAISKKSHHEKISKNKLSDIIQEIDNLIFKELNFSDEIKNDIVHFAKNLQSRV